MKSRWMHLWMALVLAASFALSGAGAAAAAGDNGAVYTLTNSAAGNEVAIFNRAADGTLTAAGSVSTGGLGTGAGLGSQGALTLSRSGRFLFAVDAGSDEISSFRVDGARLTLAGVVPSGGLLPVSVTEHDGLVYVLNAGGTGTNIVIQDCVAYDNGALNIYNDSADGTIIRRNLVYCTPGAKYGPSSGIVIGAEVNAPSNLQIVNNLCLGNWLNLVTDSNVTSADTSTAVPPRPRSRTTRNRPAITVPSTCARLHLRCRSSIACSARGATRQRRAPPSCGKSAATICCWWKNGFSPL